MSGNDFPGRSASDIGRREMLGLSAMFGSAFLAAQGLLPGEAQAQEKPAVPPPPKRKYAMKKSINLWAFPFPDKMSLEQCFRLAKDAGFDGVEINFALEGEFSAESKNA